MGMFNSIYADLVCPETKKVSQGTEIQIKWQSLESRTLSHYRAGDILENIEDEYDNTWIRTDYICRACSKHTKGYKGIAYIRVEDQKRHYVFIRIENARICAVLTEQDFTEQGPSAFVDY